MAGRTPGPDKGEGGRPIVEIDWGLVDNMAAIHCTAEEIASMLGCCRDTLNNRCKIEHDMTFSAYLEIKKGAGKMSLRRRQWKAAEAGDRTMLVWLGKQWLGQSDKQQVDATIKAETTVIYLPSNGRD